MMSVITEALLREHDKKNPHQPLKINKSDKLTPSAKEYLREQKRYQCHEESNPQKEMKQVPVQENEYRPFEVVDTGFQPKFVSYYDGGYYQEKPEWMTHLSGNQLVYKDDSRIVFRGKLDSIQSQILVTMHQLKDTKYPWLLENLDEMLQVMREILKAEVMETPYEIKNLFGLEDKDLRAHSHHPQKYYGIKHFVPNVEMGHEMVLINQLRSSLRELELVGINAFRNGSKIEREDLLRVLNRMSSAAYILMCRMRGENRGQTND